MNDRCDSCGKAWEDHDGIARTCQRLQEAKRRIAELERMLAAVDDLAGDGAMMCFQCEEVQRITQSVKGGAK